MKRFILTLCSLFFVLFSVNAFAATYYIDWNAANNSANGTSKSTPWKTHPYMGYSPAPSYNHAAGDQFIFKGGVTWPVAAFPLTITSGGSSDSVRDYYGVDQTWYTGGSWSRPIFSCSDQLCSAAGSQIWLDNTNAYYITFDNIESTGILINLATQDYPYAIYIGESDYITVKNMYFHGWTHTADCNVDPYHDFYVVSTGTSNKMHNIVEYNTVDGSASGGDIGGFVYYVPIVRFNTVHDLTNGILCGCEDIHDNVIYNIGLVTPYCGSHPNGIECLYSGGAHIYNNVIYDIDAMPLFPCPGDGGTDYIYNNVIYGMLGSSFPITIDTNCTGASGSTSYYYNNTLECGVDRLCVRINGRDLPGLGTLVFTNNHFINTDGTTNDLVCYNNSSAGHCSVSSDPVASFSNTYRLVQTTAQATAQGYTAANNYAPTDSGDSTVNAGTTIAYFNTDILGVSRPQGASWDIGAYEYGEGGPTRIFRRYYDVIIQ